MPTPSHTEIRRETIDDDVHIFYDDGSVHVEPMPATPPENLVVDADKSPKGGHKFTQKELKDRGHND